MPCFGTLFLKFLFTLRQLYTGVGKLLFAVVQSILGIFQRVLVGIQLLAAFLQLPLAVFVLGAGAADLSLHIGKVTVYRNAGCSHGLRCHLTAFIIQLVAKIQLFAVGVGQLVQGRCQRTGKNGQQRGTGRQVFHSAQYRVDLRFAGGQLRTHRLRCRNLQLCRCQLLLALLVLFFIRFVLFFLRFQCGPAVHQLLFPVRNLLPGICQFVGSIGQLLLCVGKLRFGIGYLFLRFGDLLIQIIRHFLHSQLGTGGFRRGQRVAQCLHQIVIRIGVAVQRIGVCGSHIQLSIVLGGKVLLRHIQVGIQRSVSYRGAPAAGHIHINRRIYHANDGVLRVFQIIFQIVQRVGGSQLQRLSYREAVLIHDVLVNDTFIFS